MLKLILMLYSFFYQFTLGNILSGIEALSKTLAEPKLPNVEK